MDGPETVVISDDDDDHDFKAGHNHRPERERASAKLTVSRAELPEQNSIDDLFPDFNWHILESSQRDLASQVKEHDHSRRRLPCCSPKEQQQERHANAKSQSQVDLASSDTNEFQPDCTYLPDRHTNGSVSQGQGQGCSAAVTKIVSSMPARDLVAARQQKELRVSLPCVVESDCSTRPKPTKSTSTLPVSTLQSDSNFSSLMVTAEKWLRARMASVISEALANAKQTINADAIKIQSLSNCVTTLREQIAAFETQLLSQSYTLRMGNAALQRRAEAAELSLAALTNSSKSKQSVATQTQAKHSSRSVESQTETSLSSFTSEHDCDCQPRQPRREEAFNSNASPSEASMVPSGRSRKERRKDSAAYEDCAATKRMKEASVTSVSPTYSNSPSSSSSAYSVLSPTSIEMLTTDRVAPTPAPNVSTTSKQSSKLSKPTSTGPVSMTPKKNNSVSRLSNEHGVRLSRQFKMERLNYGVFCKYDGPKHPQFGVRSSLPAPSFARIDLEQGTSTCKLTYDFEYDERALRTYGVKKFVVSVADSVEKRWFEMTVSATTALKTVRTAQAGHMRLFGASVDVSERLRDSAIVLYFYVQALDRNAQLGRLSMPFGARIYPRV